MSVFDEWTRTNDLFGWFSSQTPTHRTCRRPTGGGGGPVRVGGDGRGRTDGCIMHRVHTSKINGQVKMTLKWLPLNPNTTFHENLKWLPQIHTFSQKCMAFTSFMLCDDYWQFPLIYLYGIFGDYCFLL